MFHRTTLINSYLKTQTAKYPTLHEKPHFKSIKLASK